MLVVLGLACFALARLGAKWQLAATPPDEDPPETPQAGDCQQVTQQAHSGADETQDDE
jgi:hypothetical protein